MRPQGRCTDYYFLAAQIAQVAQQHLVDNLRNLGNNTEMQPDCSNDFSLCVCVCVCVFIFIFIYLFFP